MFIENVQFTLLSSLVSMFAGAWQNPQQYFARIRKSEDTGPGFRFLDIDQIQEPNFNVKGIQ